MAKKRKYRGDAENKKDAEYDKKHGIKEGSKEDESMDRKRKRTAKKRGGGAGAAALGGGAKQATGMAMGSQNVAKSAGTPRQSAFKGGLGAAFGSKMSQLVHPAPMNFRKRGAAADKSSMRVGKRPGQDNMVNPNERLRKAMRRFDRHG